MGLVRRAQPLGGDYACGYADMLPYCKLSVDALHKGAGHNSSRNRTQSLRFIAVGNWTRFVNHSAKRANLGWRDVFANGS